MATIQKPARWRWKRTVLAVSAVLVCGVLTLLAIRPFNGIWDVQLEAEFNRDLPYGATEEDARAWFASHNYFHTSETICVTDSTRKQYSGGISAMVPNDTLFESAEIYIDVLFDRQGCVCEKHFRRWVRCL